ncbi:hypothetical protein [Pseudomonas koreensis]|uniref:Uncharacterized protein n=1 Tax=Pseudomonas koreensis TaxID=198620 RepID=A0AA94EUY8_9PSED|nr:hypothetical protein [Pseudomonas koreensis]RVD80044.1 hypothetical protein A9HBioS_0568 [Pseudomonas koreensis]
MAEQLRALAMYVGSFRPSVSQLRAQRVSLASNLVIQVAEGMGYSILAHAAVQEDIAKGLLVGHAIERPGIRSTVSLTTLRERRNSRLALSWEKILLETLEELVTVGAWKDATLWLGKEGA